MKQLCEADAAPLIQQRDTINTPVTCGDGQNPRRHCEELTRGHHWFLLILNCSFGTWDDDYITAVCDHCSTIGTQKTLVGPIHLLLTYALIFLLSFCPCSSLAPRWQCFVALGKRLWNIYLSLLMGLFVFGIFCRNFTAWRHYAENIALSVEGKSSECCFRWIKGWHLMDIFVSPSLLFVFLCFW